MTVIFDNVKPFQRLKRLVQRDTYTLTAIMDSFNNPLNSYILRIESRTTNIIEGLFKLKTQKINLVTVRSLIRDYCTVSLKQIPTNNRNKS